MQIGDNYVSIYASYELNTIKNVTVALVYVHFTLLAFAPEQIFLPHSTYMPTLHCYWSLHIDPIYCTNQSKNCKFINHVTAIYVSKTNMSLNYHVYAKC